MLVETLSVVDADDEIVVECYAKASAESVVEAFVFVFGRGGFVFAGYESGVVEDTEGKVDVLIEGAGLDELPTRFKIAECVAVSLYAVALDAAHGLDAADAVVDEFGVGVEWQDVIWCFAANERIVNKAIGED